MQARLENDVKAAMKAGEKRRLSTLRLLLSAFKNERIEKQRELTAEEGEALIRRAVKQRKEAIEAYEKGNRPDAAAAEKEELGILEAYLPRSFSEAELEEAVREIIREKGFTSGKDVGLLMKELMARHRGKVDGKLAQETARRLLT